MNQLSKLFISPSIPKSNYKVIGISGSTKLTTDKGIKLAYNINQSDKVKVYDIVSQEFKYVNPISIVSVDLNFGCVKIGDILCGKDTEFVNLDPIKIVKASSFYGKDNHIVIANINSVLVPIHNVVSEPMKSRELFIIRFNNKNLCLVANDILLTFE